MGNRIVILGNAGGGKSRLARGLADSLGLPLHSLDQLLWRPGWVRTPAAEFDTAHDRLLEGERWIIDGVATLESIERRLAACDTVVLVDLPFTRHLAFALKRQWQCLFREREDFVPGCPMVPMTVPLLRMMAWYHRVMRSEVAALVDRVRADRHWYPIRSVAELDAFASRYCKAGSPG